VTCFLGDMVLKLQGFTADRRPTRTPRLHRTEHASGECIRPVSERRLSFQIGRLIDGPRLDFLAMYYEIVGTNVRLAGSLHRWPADVGPKYLPTWVWEAYTWSQQLYLEANLADAAQFRCLADGSSLQTRLPASVWTELRQRWPPTADVSSLRPWVALMALQFLGTAMVDGVEPQLAARAHSESKPIHYLETMTEFADRADSASPSDYAEAFSRVFSGLEGIQNALREMYGTWLTRSVEDVEALLPRTLLGIPIVMKLILDDRNVTWLPRIEGALDTRQRTLIVVGAAHLPRSTGLLSLLKRKRYEVKLVREHP